MKARKAKVLLEKGLSHKQEHNAEHTETDHDMLIRKVDSITKTCTKAYFNKILKNIVKENLGNATIICDYTVAKETEIYNYDGIHMLAEK